MAKGKKQSADDLLKRYSRETITLDAAVVERPVPQGRRADPVLDGLRRNVNRVVMVPLNILVVEENVRREVDEDSAEFAVLVDSIREQGIRQNIIVDLQEGPAGDYKVVVVAGQRRTLAGRKAGVKQVAALILRMGGKGERLVEGLAENLLREDLHCLDQAEAYAALVEEGWTQEQIADRFDRRHRTVLKFLRLAKYPQRAKDLIRAHRDVFTANLLFNQFVAKAWKGEADLMRALQEAVAGKPAQASAPAKPSARQRRLMKSVSRYNGLRCKVAGSDEVGRISITYGNKAALDKIIALFEADA